MTNELPTTNRARRVRVGALLEKAGPFMSTNQVARALGLSRFTAHRYAVAGEFPGAVMLSARKIVIPVRAVEDFLRNRTITGPQWRKKHHENHDRLLGVGVDSGGPASPAAGAAGEPAGVVVADGVGAAGPAPGAA